MKYASRPIKLLGDWAPMIRDVDKIYIDYPYILNLEGPVIPSLSDNTYKYNKAGPLVSNAIFPSTTHPGIAILANNHIMDYGDYGLVNTKNLLNESKWSWVGAGRDKRNAEAPIFVNISNKSVAVIARCETQFGIATSTKPGVAAFDSSIYQQIYDLKKQVDVVIVSIHAAAEMVPWPSPRRQATWRSLIDAGADVIHGHHAHVPQGWEEYKDGFIFYGLGNFCVDPQNWSWHPQGLWSLAPELEVTESELKVKIATTVIDELGGAIRVREANSFEHKNHMAYLEECNQPLSDPILLEGLWQEASVRMYNDYFAQWLGFDSPSLLKIGARHLRAKLGAFKRRLTRGSSQSAQPAITGHLLLWYHLFACDSHNDAIGTALGVLGGVLEDRRNEETARLATEWMVLR